MGTHRKVTRRAAVALAVVVLAPASTAVTTSTSAATAQPTTQAALRDGPHSKPRHWELEPGDSRSTIDVKFAESADVRLRGSRLVSEGSVSIADLDSVLTRYPGTRATRLFDGVSEEQHRRSRQEAETRSGKPQADLNGYFRLHTGPTTDVAALVDALNTLDIVEFANPAPLPVELPQLSTTDSFVGEQGYRRGTSSGGVDADYAQGVPGGKGENIAITDVEYSWNTSHEDLAKARLPGTLLATGTPCDPFNSTDHGTAVLGELVGDANEFGVTGLVPSATMHTANVSSVGATGTCGYNVAAAINLASTNSAPGDVILIEQQVGGPNYVKGSDQFGMVAAEYDKPIWTAIQQATSRGVIVVEAAGNGSQDLDDPIYTSQSKKQDLSQDSGAIMVGAGAAPFCGTSSPRSRLSFSTYGTRVNLQGWGQCVTTTGYGALLNLAPNATYTATFSGTSSASPIVAAAAASLSSTYKARNYGHAPNPLWVRSVLVATGTAQDLTTPGVLAGRIGPLPNLAKALPRTDITAPWAPTNLAASTTTRPPQIYATLTWNSSRDNVGVAFYRIYRGGVLIGGVRPTTRTYTTSTVWGANAFTVTAVDAAGNESAASNTAVVVNTNLQRSP